MFHGRTSIGKSCPIVDMRELSQRTNNYGWVLQMRLVMNWSMAGSIRFRGGDEGEDNLEVRFSLFFWPVNLH